MIHLYDNTPHPCITQKIAEPLVAITVIALILLTIHLVFFYGMPLVLDLIGKIPVF